MAVLALVAFRAVTFVVVVGLAVSGNRTLRRVLLFSVVVVLALVA